MEQIKTLLRNLSANDLQEGAGARVFNRGKSYIKNVYGLSRTDDGARTAQRTQVQADADGGSRRIILEKLAGLKPGPL